VQVDMLPLMDSDVCRDSPHERLVFHRCCGHYHQVTRLFLVIIMCVYTYISTLWSGSVPPLTAPQRCYRSQLAERVTSRVTD
jgi:hypothetical protein